MIYNLLNFVTHIGAPVVETPITDGTELMAFILLGFGLMVTGIFSKYKILCILSTGVWVHLLIDFQTDTAMVITAVGLILFNLLYATIWSR